MPTSFLSADAGFPRLTNDIPMEERMNRVQQYLFMLLEQLRYALANLGEENFNEASLAAIERAITDPIMQVVTDLQGNVSVLEQTATSLTIRITNAEGDISTLEQTAQSLTSRIGDAEGNISTLQQTAQSLTTRITNAEGDISSLEQTATSLTTRIGNAEGDISSLEQTATSLTTRIGNAEGDISSLEQTARSLTTRISNAEGDISSLEQTANKINWIVASGTSASSMTLTSDMAQLIANEIALYGVVSFNDLQNPASQAFINGSNMLLQSDSTGNSGSYFQFLNEYGHDYGTIWTLDTSYYQRSDLFYDEVMFTVQADGGVDGKSCGLWLLSLAGLVISGARVKIESNGDLYLTGGNGVYIEGNRYPSGISGCYSFCADGIYYGNTRILAI